VITGLDESAIAPQILSEANVQIRREFGFPHWLAAGLL